MYSGESILKPPGAKLSQIVIDGSSLDERSDDLSRQRGEKDAVSRMPASIDQGWICGVRPEKGKHVGSDRPQAGPYGSDRGGR